MEGLFEGIFDRDSGYGHYYITVSVYLDYASFCLMHASLYVMIPLLKASAIA